MFFMNTYVESKQYFVIPSNVSSQLLPYNFKSIMHLPCREYSMNGLMTIVPKDVYVCKHIMLGNSLPHEQDYLHLNILYCNGEFVNIANMSTA